MEPWNSYSRSPISQNQHSYISRILLPKSSANHSNSSRTPHVSRYFPERFGSSLYSPRHLNSPSRSYKSSTSVPTLLNFLPDPCYKSSIFKLRSKPTRTKSLIVETVEPSSHIQLGMRMMESKKRLPSTVVHPLSPVVVDQSVVRDSKRRRLENPSSLETSDISSLGDNRDSSGFRFTSIDELKNSVDDHSYVSFSKLDHPFPSGQRNGFIKPIHIDSHSFDSEKADYKTVSVSSEASLRRRIPYMSPAELDALFQSKKNNSFEPKIEVETSDSDMDDSSTLLETHSQALTSAVPQSSKKSASVDLDLQHRSLQLPPFSTSSDSSTANIFEGGPPSVHKVNSVSQFIASLEAHSSHIKESINGDRTVIYSQPHLSDHHPSPSDMDSRVMRIRGLLSSSSLNLVTSSSILSPLSRVSQPSATEHTTAKVQTSSLPPAPILSAPSITTTPIGSLTPLIATGSTANPAITSLPSLVPQSTSAAQHAITPPNLSFTFSFPTTTISAITTEASVVDLSSSECNAASPRSLTTVCVSDAATSTSSLTGLFSSPTTSLSTAVTFLSTSTTPFTFSALRSSVATSLPTSTVPLHSGPNIIVTSSFSSPFEFSSKSAVSSVVPSSTCSPLVFSSFSTKTSTTPSIQPPAATTVPTFFSMPAKYSFTTTPVSMFTTKATKPSELISIATAPISTTSLFTTPLTSVAAGSTSAPSAVISTSATSTASGQPFQFGVFSNTNTISSSFAQPFLTTSTRTTSTTLPSVISSNGITVSAVPSSTSTASTTTPTLSFVAPTLTTTTTATPFNTAFSFSSASKPFSFSLAATTTNSAPVISSTTATATASSVTSLFSFSTSSSPIAPVTTSSFFSFGSITSSQPSTCSSWTSLPTTVVSTPFSLGIKSATTAAANTTVFGAPSLFGKLGGGLSSASSPFSSNTVPAISSSPFTFSTSAVNCAPSVVDSIPQQPFQFGVSISSGASNITGGALTSPAFSAPNLFAFGQSSTSQNMFQPATTSSAFSTAATTSLFHFGSSSTSTTPNLGFNFSHSSASPSILGSTQSLANTGFVFGQPALNFGSQSQPGANPFTFGTTGPNPTNAMVAPKRRPIANRRTRRP